MTPNVLTDFSTVPLEAGKGGEGGDLPVTNAKFVAAVFPTLPDGAFAAVCSKSGDPDSGGWPASRGETLIDQCPAEHNNYVGCTDTQGGRKPGRRCAQGTRVVQDAVGFRQT